MRLMLIHTGGTIGMGATKAGYAPQQGVLEAALLALNAPDVALVTLEPLIDSANATFADWNRIAQTIGAAQDEIDGFVVTHGTDTLAFTAAALCLALQGLRRPVILTGSMVPLGVDGSDGMANLSNAIDAARTAPPGVWVQFAGQLLHGARLRKAHSQNTDAFAAAPCAAAPLHQGQDFTLHAYGAPQITILTMAPGASIPALDAALTVVDGAVLRVFGAGTIPNDPALANALRKAQARGTAIIAVSQSPEGGIRLGTYAAGNLMLETGVIDGGDMTPEAAFAKLAHVLSRPAETRAALLSASLCGEKS